MLVIWYVAGSLWLPTGRDVGNSGRSSDLPRTPASSRWLGIYRRSGPEWVYCLCSGSRESPTSSPWRRRGGRLSGDRRIWSEWASCLCSDSRGPSASPQKGLIHYGVAGGLARWRDLSVDRFLRFVRWWRLRVVALQLVRSHDFLYLAAIAYQPVGVGSKGIRNPIWTFKFWR